MASRTYYGVKALDKEVTQLFGKLTIGSTGAITASTCYGFSVARTGTGAYTITLSDKYSEMLFANFRPGNATAVDTDVQVVADLASGVTVTFLHKSAGSAADPASGSFLFIHLVLKNTNQTP